MAPNFVYYNFVLHEAFNEFHACLNDNVNSSFNLGEKMLNNRIVRKIMKSLPERFRSKVIAIEESKC